VSPYGVSSSPSLGGGWGEVQGVAQLINFLYICNMKREIIAYGGYFEAFLQTLSTREQEKVEYSLIVVLFNGFQKKTQKTPSGEIDKAIRIKEKYYAEKRT
jgi:hypothetical protein